MPESTKDTVPTSPGSPKPLKEIVAESIRLLEESYKFTVKVDARKNSPLMMSNESPDPVPFVNVPVMTVKGRNNPFISLNCSVVAYKLGAVVDKKPKAVSFKTTPFVNVMLGVTNGLYDGT